MDALEIADADSEKKDNPIAFLQRATIERAIRS